MVPMLQLVFLEKGSRQILATTLGPPINILNPLQTAFPTHLQTFSLPRKKTSAHVFKHFVRILASTFRWWARNYGHISTNQRS